jgi:hypothetical protein
LGILDFTKPFAIETDACQNGVGAVLLQNGHLLAYVSKPLGLKTQGLSIYEKEYNAILVAVEKWRSYLQLAEFEIHTDQQALVHLNDQRLHTIWQQKVFTRLLGLHYRVIYKKGVDNGATDAVSRRHHPAIECFALSAVTPSWCADLRAGHDSDDQAIVLLTKLATNLATVPHFSLVDGLIRYRTVRSFRLINRVKQAMQTLIQQHLVRAQNRVKLQANKNRTECTFNVGD